MQKIDFWAFWSKAVLRACCHACHLSATYRLLQCHSFWEMVNVVFA